MRKESHAARSGWGKASGGTCRRQFTVALTLVLLAACSSRPAAVSGTVGDSEGFVGAVVADEPQAALVGREVLLSGGNAVDAAVAMYFTMAVTLPSQASLGGGGVCLVFNYRANEGAALQFLARAPATVPPGADRPTAVPGNVRGFYALHARFGRSRWAELLAPAENFARFGVPVSRALARDLGEVDAALAAEPQVRRVFSTEGGTRLVQEGDVLTQFELASVIARIRTQGPGDFYAGTLATQIAEGARRAGGSLDRQDLADYEPVWEKPLAVSHRRGVEDDRTAWFVPPPPAGGVVAGQIWAQAVKDNAYADAALGDREAILVSDAARAFADRSRWETRTGSAQELVSGAYLEAMAGRAGGVASAGSTGQAAAENPAAASLVAIDREGSGVVCSVSMNSLFGTGRMAAGTGIVLAALPGQGGRGAAMLAPMLVVQPRGRQFVFAGAAAGGVAGPTSVTDVAARVLLSRQPLGEAIAAPRIHGGSDPRIVFAEPQASARSLQVLLDRGYEAVTTTRIGRVAAISCPDGLRTDPESCTAASDPRGYGLAASTE